ncbi:hypothetical protein GCM10010399_00230 [Dactylosporangium fulvum]|uniref:DNA polymerase beta n=1 Tax=Dactylosporangium fulvum TaxID=53359 RepID=A0ABY5VRZ6_9ACTN|nr:helix-hairpin-helix domain-containing protein [Dactylosporangium fulvum]UWP79589.1 helix-hairpin-helix domain-containing protein [Dactylosporangium fulvum]
MVRPNEVVERVLHEYADLMAITGGDAHRARAYEKAARVVGGYPADVSAMDEESLREIPNVGASIADKILEFLGTGRIRAVEELRAEVPGGVVELTRIPTLGPKKAMVLYSDLGIASIEELRDAVEAGMLTGHRGFGAKTAENILHGITLLERGHGRSLLSDATEAAEEIVTALSRVKGCVRCTYAGSLRRMRETIGDVDVRACEHPYVTVIGHPTTRLLGRRPPVEADFDAVFRAAAATGTALEVNGFPDRLDLSDELILRARRHGVKFAVNTDAHAVVHLDHLRYGIGTAQRGWLTAEDVVNTWPLDRLEDFIGAKRRRRAKVAHRR